MLGTILHYHYKIVDILGIGKSGITYLATDIDCIDSPLYVVKKIQYVNLDINLQAVTPQLTEKLFEIQGSIANQVGKHPQIPTLIAKFEDNGDHYLIREYIDGEFLSQELTPGNIWSQTQILEFLTDLVGILVFIHSFGYIHQDINPNNIIRRKDNGEFNLIGFSSVWDLASTWQNSPSHNSKNINDPNYTPYEQEQNAPKLNSDIYAVGAIAIQALTGKFPIEKDAYSYELKWQDEVTIDRNLSKIINKMVRPDYRNRYQSAVEVLQALQSFLLTQHPVKKPFQLHPYLFFIAPVCALLLGFGLSKLSSNSVSQAPASAPVVGNDEPIKSISGMNWKSYLDKSTGIEMKYAPNWDQQDTRNIVTGENVVFTNTDQSSTTNYRENISIRIENLSNQQTTLSSYTQSTIAEIGRYYQDAKIIESSAIIFANRPGNLVVYTGKDENSTLLKNLEVWTIYRGKVYILTYKATPSRYYQFLETAMSTINSFKLK
jgi:eukaryotic-like serine/threonine-protein kinase